MNWGTPTQELIETVRAGFAADGDTLIGYRVESESDGPGRWKARAFTFIGYKSALEVDANTELGVRSSVIHSV